MTEQGNVLRKQLVKEELLLNEIETKEAETENTAQMTIIILDKLKVSLITTKEKILRSEKKLKTYQEDFLAATEKLVSKTQKNTINRSFPCACCRTELSIENCITSGDKKEIKIFNQYLEKAIVIYNKELELEREIEIEKDGKEEKNEKQLETVFSTLTTEPAVLLQPMNKAEKTKLLKYPSFPNSVSTLPLETQKYVQEIQRQQQECWNMRSCTRYG